MADVTYNPHFEDFFSDEKFYKILYGSAGCFDGNTLVNTSQGYRKIRDIEKGELVLSFNENTKKPEYKRVLNKFRYWSGDIRQKIITFTLINQKITCTDEHKFYFEGTWTMAKDIARRAMESGGKWERNVLYQRHGKAYDHQPLQQQEVGSYEAFVGYMWILQDYDCEKEYPKQIYYDKDSQACCGGICSQSAQQTRGESQEWHKDGQQAGKFGVGNAQGECSALIQEPITNKRRVEESYKQAHRGAGKGNKANPEAAYDSQKDSVIREVRGSDWDYQTPCLQAGQGLAARTIDLSEIKEIVFSAIPQFVYDLEVEDNSNYCITTNDIIVHNSGKSYAIAQKLVLRCLNEEGHTCWAFRKVSTYIEQSVFATILQVVEDCGATSLVHINKTQRTIHFKNNGNKIICAGLDDEEKIKSILNVTIAWVEEATEFNEQDINQLDLRMRGESKVYRELILSFNPVSELHWIKRKFFDEVTPGIQSKLYTNHSTFRENYFLDRDYKERLIQNHSHDPNNYRVYVLGEWGKVVTGQEYYKNFHEDMHVRANEYDDSLPIHLTFDFNTAPYMSASVWQIEKVGEIYEVRGLDELVMKHPKNSTEDTCYEFLERWGDKCANGLLIYGDATGRARKTSSKKTDYMIIEQILGHLIVEMRVPRSNPLPQDKHTFMNRMMYGTFPIRMYVHPDMKFTLQDLTHVLEDQERKKVKARARDPVSKQVVEKFGHFSDAMDYFFMEAFKPFIV